MVMGIYGRWSGRDPASKASTRHRGGRALPIAIRADLVREPLRHRCPAYQDLAASSGRSSCSEPFMARAVRSSSGTK